MPVPTLEEFQQRVTDAELRGLRIIQYAMAGGVLLLAAVVVWLATQPTSGAGGPIMPMATLVNFVFAGTLFPVALGLPTFLYRQMAATLTDAAACFAAYRRAWVARLALMEAAALFGVVVLFLGASTGALQAQSLYWLNALPTVLFLVFVFKNPATRDRALAEFRTKMWPRFRG